MGSKTHMNTPHKKDKEAPGKGKEALGKGIRSLLQSIDADLKTTSGDLKPSVVEAATNMLRVPLEQIETNPRQPRHDFDEVALQELAHSIRLHDIIQPVTVSRLPSGKYRLISGERRYRAARMAELKDIPAYVRQADDQQLLELARRHGVAEHVVLTGGVPVDELAAHYAAGDVFAMPCRTRRAGMDVEGLGIVYLEASAVGLPVVAGDSGGAPDAVREGETGYVVDGRDTTAVAVALVRLLSDQPLRTKVGLSARLRDNEASANTSALRPCSMPGVTSGSSPILPTVKVPSSACRPSVRVQPCHSSVSLPTSSSVRDCEVSVFASR